MKHVISVKGLTKNFGSVKAVDDLSFSVDRGGVYGFLGQNGAGKSTTIRMLLTLIRPDDGEIEIFGLDLFRHRKEILRQVGAIIERPDLYKYLSALENLRIFAKMSGMISNEKRLMDQLEIVGLAERAHSKVKTYSQGMKQRLGIAIALVHEPELIILDEPTNGLDPQGIADIRKLIIHLSREQGKTMLISSHLLGEMQLIADSMLIIDKGKKLAEGKVQDLFNPAEMVVELNTTDNAGSFEKLVSEKFIDLTRDPSTGLILFKTNRDHVPPLVKKLVEMNVQIISVHARHSLEDYFLSLTAERVN